MKLTVKASSVHWSLPDEPFVYLAVNQEGTPKPRDFVFERTQYETAFQDLITELKSLEEIHGTLKIHPVSNRRSTLDEEIDVERSWAEYRRVLRSALGEMDEDNIEFVVKTQEDLELTTPLSQFVYEVTREFLTAGMYDLAKTREALDRLGHDLRTDPGILLRQLDVHQLSASLRATNVTVSDEDDEAERWPAPYWTGPDSPQEKIDFWIDVQRTGVASVRKRQW